MDQWLHDLTDDLHRRQKASLLRRLRPVRVEGRFVHVAGRQLVNLAGNDYLALARHERLKQAATEAILAHGVGAGASRLVSGHAPWHVQVERQFADFKHAEAALLCPAGYMANHAALTALAGERDLIGLDKLNHASLLDAALASGATCRIYPHRQLAKLERLLQKPARRKLIVTDSVFSMDGDVADLPALCDLADRYDAILVVDEAHGTGVLGDRGSGLCEAQGVSDRVDVVISTASKALGGLGGIVTARQEVIDTLVNHARSFIYTTAVPPAQAAALAAALEVVRDEPWRRHRVREHALRLRTMLGMDSALPTPIVPVHAGSAEDAGRLADHLEKHGFFSPAIRPPTVPPGAARVRICLRADLETEDVERIIAALGAWRAS